MPLGHVLERIEIGFTQRDEQSLNLDDVHGHLDQKGDSKRFIYGIIHYILERGTISEAQLS